MAFDKHKYCITLIENNCFENQSKILRSYIPINTNVLLKEASDIEKNPGNYDNI